MASTAVVEQDYTTSADLESALHGISRNVTKTKGSTLFRLGDEPIGLFLVRKGKVRLAIDGTSIGSRTLGCGSVLGLPATLNRKPYSMTATALEECELDFVDCDAVLKLFRENCVLCFQALQLLSEEVFAMRKAIETI